MKLLSKISLILILVIITILFSSLTLAEDCYQKNYCSSTMTQAKSNYEVSLNLYFSLLDDNNPELYKEVLYDTYKGKSNEAKSLFNSLSSSEAPEGKYLIYSVWAKRKGADITLDISKPSSLTEDNYIDYVAYYLYSEDTSMEQPLIDFLEERAIQSWEAEKSPLEMEKVVISLMAIYDSTSNELLKKRAEMSLDYIFAIQAATSLNGEYNLVGEDFSTNYAYPYSRNDFMSWNELLFGINGKSATEPGILIIDYCVNQELLSIREQKNDVENAKPIIANLRLGKISSGSFYSRVYSTPYYSITSIQDLHEFYSLGKNALKASLRFKDGSFINPWSKTTSETKADNNFIISATKQPILLGKLLGGSCVEPNIFLSSSNNLASSYYVQNDKGEQALLIIYGEGSSNELYLFIRFENKINRAKIEERYASLAATIPSFIYESDGERVLDAGEVLYPGTTDDQYFVIEVLNNNYIYNLLDEGLDDNEIAKAILDNSSFTYDDGGLTYVSPSKKEYVLAKSGNSYQLLENNQQYLYDKKDDDIHFANGEEIYTVDPDQKTITISAKDGGKNLVLNFGEEDLDLTKTAFEDSYGCGDETISSSNENLVLESVNDKLGFIAASFQQELGKNYIIDCGKLQEILGLKSVDAESVSQEYGCIINNLDNHKKSLAIALTGDVSMTEIADAAEDYYPYLKWSNSGKQASSLVLPDSYCSEVFDLSDTSPVTFTQCQDELGNINSWLNAEAGILILSQDTNPFTTGLFDSIGDWISNLFSNSVTVEEPQVQGIDRGYFSNLNNKEFKATMNNGEITLFTNQVDLDLNLIAESLGIANQASYKEGPKQQLLRFSSTDLELWNKITKKIRLSGSLGGSAYSGDCGSTNIFEQECSPGETAYCFDNSNVQKTCGDDCKWDISDCEECRDLDNDGYFAEGCPEEEIDFFDEDPSIWTSAQGYTCSGENEDSYENGDIDSIKSFCNLKSDGEFKYAGCPQCANPGFETELCDCYPNTGLNGLVSESNICSMTHCDFTSLSETQFSGECEEPSDCENICNISIVSATTCTSDSNCDSGHCYEGDCVECEQDSDCEDGYKCSANKDCVKKTSGGGGGSCFTGDTLITLGDSEQKPISEILVGDKVLSYDVKAQELVITEVQEVLVHDNAKKLLVINNNLEVTPEHVVYSSKGWQAIGSLRIGDYLFDKNMRKIVISSIREEKNTQLVYNLHLTEPNNYFANGYLVHNIKSYNDLG